MIIDGDRLILLRPYEYGAVEVWLDTGYLGTLDIADEISMDMVEGHRYYICAFRTSNETWVCYTDMTTTTQHIVTGLWSDANTFYLEWRSNSSVDLPFEMNGATFTKTA